VLVTTKARRVVAASTDRLAQEAEGAGGQLSEQSRSFFLLRIAPQPLPRLRKRRNRPRRRHASNKRYEFAPSHCLPEAQDKASYLVKQADWKG
jgi:hypothetical protein